MKFKLTNPQDLRKDSVIYHLIQDPNIIFDTTSDLITDGTYSVRILDLYISKDYIKVLPELTEIPKTKVVRIYDNSVRYYDFNTIKDNSYGYTKSFLTPDKYGLSDFTTTVYTKQGTNFIVSGRCSLRDLSYEPLIEPDADDNAYTLPDKVTVQLLEDYTTEQIRSRYLFIDRARNGLQNVVVDSFLPRLLYKYKMNVPSILYNNEISKTSYSVSPFIAGVLGTNQIPLSDLLTYFDYNDTKLKKVLMEVKKKQLDFVFLGLGGTGSNTLYWLSKMCEQVNIINLFNKIAIYEKDKIDISNTIRFPYPIQDYYQMGTASKIKMAEKYAEKLSTKRIMLKEQFFSYTMNRGYVDSDLFNYVDNFTPKDTTILYGAPELAYRNAFSKKGNFISATHAGNECSLWLNPIADDNITIETYGLIQLNTFFMNQIKLVLGLLELLASDQDLKEQDKHIFDHEFTGIPLGKPSRVYNWQISAATNVLTEAEAVNI